jgi:hypothetical protein
MRKGFDLSLANALRVDRRTLFVEYITIAPSFETANGIAEKLRLQIKASLYRMDESSLRIIHATAQACERTGAHAA